GVDGGDRAGIRHVDRADLRAERRGRDRDDVAVVGAARKRDRPGGAAEQLDAVEVGGAADARDLRLELSGLGGDRRLVGRGERAVAVLHGELTHALEHRVHLAQRAFRGLDQAHPVLGVALRLRETTDLTTELLADGESGCVVGRTVDAVSRAEALHRLAGTIARGGELAMGVEGLDVRVDAKGQVVFSLMTLLRGGRFGPEGDYAATVVSGH